MTGILFLEYLYWFNGQIASRSVLLLVDGFLAYTKAFKELTNGAGL